MRGRGLINKSFQQIPIYLTFYFKVKNMIVKNPKFEISAVGPNQYPKSNLPEIVLAGKSNVGKSSFINTMINRKSLARTSSEPGKTRQINFYNIDQKFYFVDLPGFGYSKMSHAEIDIRHKPSENDILMFNYIKNARIPYVVLANKADKIAVTKVDSIVNDLKAALQVNESDIVLPFSSERKIYEDKVWEKIELYI